jgi:SAM-dependent methyltransferase
MNSPASITYLPVQADGQLHKVLLHQDYEAFFEPVCANLPYERVGFDRLLAILVDLKLLDIKPSATVLDIGCNNGLFSLGLAALGYKVTGIESNIAVEVIPGYPPRLLDDAELLKERLHLQHVEFIEADIADYLACSPQHFDVCLLLSVVHQWSAGYASSGMGAKPYEIIEQLLTKLVSQVDHVLYYEGPETEELAQAGTLPLPAWFATHGFVKRIVPIAVSVAANGELRTLYRLERNIMGAKSLP